MWLVVSDFTQKLAVSCFAPLVPFLICCTFWPSIFWFNIKYSVAAIEVSAVVQSSFKLIVTLLSAGAASVPAVAVNRPAESPVSICHLSAVKYPDDAPIPVTCWALW